MEQPVDEFILINNVGINVSYISHFYYNSEQEEISISIKEGRKWCWFVPLGEGRFILHNLQKALNERKNFNFHFERIKPKSLWHDFFIF